jgi:hypothetical protein
MFSSELARGNTKGSDGSLRLLNDHQIEVPFRLLTKWPGGFIRKDNKL